MTAGHRPALAENGKPFESVWDFPRPPRLEQVPWRIVVVHHGQMIVDAPRALRVLETSQPPAYYVDPGFVEDRFLSPSSAATYCEWKGQASYVDIDIDGDIDRDIDGERVAEAGWRYDRPTAPFQDLTGHYAFYAQKLDQCFVDDEQVAPNEGGFYGGWITANVTGPFKGGPRTSHW